MCFCHNNDLFYIFFFFSSRRRHTSWPRDWSSDVCSSDLLLALLVDNRGFPLFALLFGYGIGILYRASQRRGESSRRFLARQARRHLVLLVFGLLHGILLFTGDILAAYAIIGMLCAWLATRGRS